MSAIRVNGVAYVAGLEWLPKGNLFDTAREARKVGSVWCAYDGEQTGYAGGSRDHQAGLPVMAAALRAKIPGDRWMALVPGDDGRCVAVQVGDGVILGSGDRIFATVAEAVDAVREVKELGWEIYATAGLVEGAILLDPAGLSRAVVLGRVPFLWATRRRAVSLGVAATLVGAVWTGFSYRDEIWRWIEGPVVQEQATEEVEEPRITVGLDSVALVEGCREGMSRFVPEMPGWERVSLTCRARFADPELTGVRPGFEGRPVLAVRWRLESGRSESLYRQLAEDHLARWKVAGGGALEGQVVGAKAWVAVVLPAVTVEAVSGAAMSRLLLRKAVDRRFGMVARLIRHGGDVGGIRIETGETLPSIAKLVDGMGGFEVTGLTRVREGWLLEGRGTRPVSMTVSKFRALRRAIQ